MSAPHDNDDDLNATQTSGYKVTAKKTVDEYANLDEGDESLARWKASLGIHKSDPNAGAGASAGGEPKVTVKKLFLTSPSRPEDIELDVTNPAALEKVKKEPIVIKEGAEYSVGVECLVENAVVTGLRYIHVVKRSGVKVDKLEQMIGSYGPNKAPHRTTFITEEAPSGMIARSGTYHVKSRVFDDDNHTYAEFDWSFKLAKEW